MKEIKIRHETIYQFESEVFPEPHLIRLKPQLVPYLELKYFKLELTPSPTGIRELSDENNNLIHLAWFSDTTEKITILSESILKVKEYDPFFFLISPSKYTQLPFQYDASQRSLLASVLERIAISDELLHFSDSVLEGVNGDTIQFLINITRQFHDDFNVIYREEGVPLEPEVTFFTKEGSCRDLAWMLIGVLRYYKIAARFVSGYYYFEMEEANYELHAWVEAFIPGAGWVGLDPAHGILTGSQHFPVAVSANYEHTMPVTGSYRGSARSELITNLSIDLIADS